MTVKENVNALNKMLNQGKILEAFDKFYADDIVMQENYDEPRLGRQANREYEENFVNYVEEMSAECHFVAVDEAAGVAVTEWNYDMKFKDGNAAERLQRSIQHWNDGKVVREQFLYQA